MARKRIARKAVGIVIAGAVVAGGLAITSMAAWSEPQSTEPDSSAFFELQHSVSGDNWVGNRATPSTAVVAIDIGGIPAGATAYGYVSVRTSPESVGGSVLMTASEHAAGDPLYDALRYGARIVPSAADCSASGMSVADLVPFGSGMSGGAGEGFVVEAAAASARVICIALTVPEGSDPALESLTTRLEWQFVGTAAQE